MTNNNRRKVLRSAGLSIGTVAATQMVPSKWTKPIIESVILPAHAQTSAACDLDTLVVSITMDDLSDLAVQLFRSGSGGGLLEEFTQGSFSGDGTIELFNRCESADECYEIVFRNGSGTVEYSFSENSESRSFTSPVTVLIGAGCQ